jgi:hypothetical protein
MESDVSFRRTESDAPDRSNEEMDFMKAAVEENVETESAVPFTMIESKSPDRATDEGDLARALVEQSEQETANPMLTPEPIDDPRAMEISKAPVGKNGDGVCSGISDPAKARLKEGRPDCGGRP